MLQPETGRATYGDYDGDRGGRDSLSPGRLGRTQDRFATTTRRPLSVGSGYVGLSFNRGSPRNKLGRCPSLLFVPLPDPRLVRGHVLHALAAFDKVAVHEVNHAVVALDNGWIVVAALFLLLQMPRDGPRAAFIF